MVYEEPRGEIPLDFAWDCSLTKFPDLVRVGSVHRGLGHESAPVTVNREVLAYKLRDLLCRQLLPSEFVGRIQQNLQL